MDSRRTRLALTAFGSTESRPTDVGTGQAVESVVGGVVVSKLLLTGWRSYPTHANDFRRNNLCKRQ